jgi:hypothetical protein
VRQLPIDHVHRNPIALVCPGDGVACRPLLAFGKRHVLRDPQGVGALIALHRRPNDTAVPDSVQVCLLAQKRHRHIIAATVVVVGSMKRLVEITDEMYNVFERFEPLALRSLWVGQDALELFDLRNYALLLRTVADSIIARRLSGVGMDRDAYEVPPPRFGVLRSNLGPC